MIRTLAAAALALALSAPATAQVTVFPAGSGLPAVVPFQTGFHNTAARDDISTRIDRRESARFRAARAARKARERAERERVARAG